MKDIFLLKRLAAVTLVFFSLFLLIDFVPNSVSSESSSSDGCSSDDDNRSPMEKYKDSLLNEEPETQPVELPDNFGEDVQPDPKPGATHNKRRMGGSDEVTITQTPSSDGCGVDEVRVDKDSGFLEYRIDGKGAGLEITEETAVDGDGNMLNKEHKVKVWIVVEF